MRALHSLAVLVILALAGCATASSAQSVMPREMPNTSVALTDGGELTLGDARGEVTVLAFFTTYCPTSPAALRTIQALRARNKSGALRLVAVYEGDTDSPAEIDEFAARLGLRVPVALDKHGVVARQLGLITVPSIVVVDQSGTIRHVHAGYHGDNDRSALDREVTALLVEAASTSPP